MNLLLASTSTLYNQAYLSYLTKEIVDFFTAGKHILFVPFARPGGISYDEYTAKAASFFTPLGFTARGTQHFDNTSDALAWSNGIFTGGGNTFLLLKTLYETGYFTAIKTAVENGLAYMGTSAGSNVAGLSIGTTNDMPIVQPSSFSAYGWLPFNLNPHFIAADGGAEHMGETRDTRIAEFLTQNAQPVMGLREGSWLKVIGKTIELKGALTARVFRQNIEPFEIKPGIITL